MLSLFQVGIVLGEQTTNVSDLQILITTWLFKIMFIVAAGLYLAFAFVVTRQIYIMRSTIITPFSSFITTLGYFHLLMAIMVFISFLLVL